ncbi:MAG: hypothetical protein E6Q40_10280 [Cupriavidus sp.]|nr:MAG: hypothetical protein E6Q40_10280 [Cupriavidus sp.]
MILRQPPLLIADAVALDFLNSVVSFPQGTIDFMADGEGLLAWMTEARLIEPSFAGDMRLSSTSEELDGIAAQARELREWFRAFVTARKGRKIVAADLPALARLNDMLRMDDTFTRLVPSSHTPGYPYRLETVRRHAASIGLLMTIAETLARFVCADAMMRVKCCEGPGCTLVFEDRTQGRSRRWCGAPLCGDDTRVADARAQGLGARSQAW